MSENGTSDSEETELVGFGASATGVPIGEGRASAPPRARPKFQPSELWAIALVGLMFVVAVGWLVHRFG